MRRKTALELRARYEALQPAIEARYPLITYAEAEGQDQDAFIAAETAIGEQRAAAYREAMPELAPALARDRLMTRIFFISFAALAGATAVLMLFPIVLFSFLGVVVSVAAIAVLLYVVLYERVMKLSWQRSEVPNFYLEYEVTTSLLRELDEQAGLPAVNENDDK